MDEVKKFKKLCIKAGFNEEKTKYMSIFLFNTFKTREAFFLNVSAGGPSDFYNGEDIQWPNRDDPHDLRIASFKFMREKYTGCIIL